MVKKHLITKQQSKNNLGQPRKTEIFSHMKNEAQNKSWKNIKFLIATGWIGVDSMQVFRGEGKSIRNIRPAKTNCSSWRWKWPPAVIYGMQAQKILGRIFKTLSDKRTIATVQNLAVKRFSFESDSEFMFWWFGSQNWVCDWNWNFITLLEKFSSFSLLTTAMVRY